MIGALLVKARVRRAFTRMSRTDIGLVEGMDDRTVFEFPGRTPISGRYEGVLAIRAFWERVFARLEYLDIRPVRIALSRPLAWGADNTALVQWVADERTRDGVTAHLEGVAVIEIEHGRVRYTRDYIFDTAPLEAVWGKAPVRAPVRVQAS